MSFNSRAPNAVGKNSTGGDDLLERRERVGMKMREENCEPTKLRAGILVGWGEKHGVRSVSFSGSVDLLEYEGDVRRRPEEGLCARWRTRVVSSSTSSSPHFSSGRCGFPFSAQEVEVSFGGPLVASMFKFIVQVLVQTLLVTR